MGQQLYALYEMLQTTLQYVSAIQSYVSGGLISDASQSALQVVLDYVKANGIWVSPRWRLGEEGENGSLFIRDVHASQQGINARYKLRNATYVNL